MNIKFNSQCHINANSARRTAEGAMALLVAALMSAVGAASAADYVSPAGPSDAIASSATYDTMTITNALTVQGGAVVTVPTVTMTGGSLTVTGNGTSFGENRSGNDYVSTRTTYTLHPDANGAYPLLAAESSGALKIYSATFAAGGNGTDGVFDALRINGSMAYVRWLYNDSSLTGRVTFAGSTASLTRQGGYATGTEHAIFMRGAWLLALDGGVAATIDVGNQRGTLNASGVSVRTTGSGDLTFKDSSDYAMVFADGAAFDHAGALVLSRSSVNNPCLFRFAAGSSIGSNVTRVEAGTDKVSLEIEDGVAINAKDFDFSRSECSVTGGGRIVVDGSAARTFKAGIPVDSTLTLEKTGAAELAVSATTNIPTLIVSGGTVRFTDDCVVGSLSIAAGTSVVADGCEVTVLSGCDGTGTFGGVNGGAVVVKANGTSHFHGIVPSGAVRVSSGSAVFSALGLPQRCWRFTFKGMSGTTPSPVRLRGIYLFGTTGAWENSGIGNSTETARNEYVTEIDTPTLAANKVRYFVHSATNVVADTSQSYYKISYLQQLFSTANGGNNRPVLLSPLVDSGNPDSWLSIEFRMNDGGNPITGYNLCNGTSTAIGAYPTAWSVFASDDGSTWTEVDSRSGETCNAASGKYYTYDGGAEYLADIRNKSVAELPGVVAEHFKFSGYRAAGLAPSALPVQVQVAGGATLDFGCVTGGEPVDRITVDFSEVSAQNPATLVGAKFAANGTLAIVNASQGYSAGSPLPLVLDDVTDAANIAGWTLTIDGNPVQGTVRIRDGRIVVGDLPTVLLFH